MPSPPFFSVIVCTFNRDQLLRRALDSVQAQTFRDFETIVVDGGTSPDTRVVAEGHLTMPRYFRIPDTGIGGSRDFGLHQARGTFSAFLDDDDEFKPEHLEARYGTLRAFPDLDLLYNGFQTIGSEYVPDLLNHGQFLHVEDPQIFHAGTSVVNTKKAIAAGGFSTDHHKHYPDNFLETARAHGLKSASVPERTYVYHRLDTSYTGQLAKAYKKSEPDTR
jgi:glycosyltransferase involved in cell wall biosynthesis